MTKNSSITCKKWN